MIDSRGVTAPPRALSVEDVAGLHGSLDPARTAVSVAYLLLEITGAQSCGLWSADPPVALAGVTAADGVVAGFAGRRASRPASLVEAARSPRPIVADAPGSELAPKGAAPLLLVPVRAGEETVAVAALDGGSVPFGPEAVAAVAEVSPVAGTALANALAHERRGIALAAAEQRVENLELLHDLGAALVERGGAEALVERLNRLLGGRDLEVESLAWKSRSLARRLGGGELTSQERALLRGSGAVEPLPDGRLAVALRAGGKALGSMRVSGAGDGDGAIPFLELLGGAVAEIADRMSLRAEVEEAARGAALAHERDRIAAGLHDTAGQLFVAIRLLARREAGQLPAASEAAARLHRLADLADQGKWEIDHAIDALALFPAARHGLAPALRSLGGSFHADGELDVIVDVYGRPVRLPAPAERALYRVVHESLANARLARCSVVRVALTFDGDGVHLEVADDGTGLTGTIPDRGRPGTSDMRRAVADAGGVLHVRNAVPCGVVVEAAIPKERA